MQILLDWRRVVDFLVLCGTFYLVLRWAERARAMRIALAIIALYSSVLIARQLDLVITTWILQGAALIAVGLLIIVFQPEVRRALMRLDRTLLATPRGTGGDVDHILAEAAFELAATRTGALFVVVRKDPVDELIQGGVILGADVSKFLIHAIFQKSSPLHDGAVIIEGGRISRAGAVLPLTLREDVPPEFGRRPRA
jgi:diadenylate cyclase